MGLRFNPHPAEDQARLLFVHIPKTAGISVYNALAEALGVDRSIRFPRNSEEEREKFLTMPEEQLRSYRLLSGHFPIPFFLRRPVSDYNPVTILRNPVDRELSAYFYIKTDPDHPLNTDWFRSLDLYQYIEHRQKNGNANAQCLFVCGERSFEKAKKAVDEQFFLTAPLDYVKDFFTVLENKLNIPLQQPVRSNKTAFRLSVDEIHPDIKSGFASLTREDLKLYMYVKAKFEKEFL